MIREEHELITRSKGGDHSAFTELVQRSSPIVLRAIRRVTYNHADAEDILQESLLNAFAKLHQFDERSAFSTWLTRIAINNAFMALRRVRQQRETSLDADSSDNDNGSLYSTLSSGMNPERICIRDNSITTVRDAIRRLPGHLRQHAEWRCLEEKPHKDIALSLGISVASSKSRAARVKRRLVKMLKAAESGIATARPRTA
jgi:RNA polymerase sigma-70 factor (ECF subfamily)